MDVTHQDLGEVVKSIFNSPVIDQSEEHVGFGLRDDHFKAEIILALQESTDKTDEEDPKQSLEIMVWFVQPDGERTNLSKLKWAKTLDLVYRLQMGLSWGQLTPYEFDASTVEIALYRCIHMDQDVIRNAVGRNPDSGLVHSVKHLVKEWKLLSPVLSGIATEQIKPVPGIERFAAEQPASH